MGYNDPLLAPKQVDYQQYIDSQLREIEIARKELLNAKARFSPPVKGNEQPTSSLWLDIDKEIASLTDDQKAILGNDETYRTIDAKLQMLIQNELIASVRDKVANSEEGKTLLEQQLANIKSKKSQIVAESNKEMELFKKFQIAVQANPNLTYTEFIKAINNNEK